MLHINITEKMKEWVGMAERLPKVRCQKNITYQKSEDAISKLCIIQSEPIILNNSGVIIRKISLDQKTGLPVAKNISYEDFFK